MSVSSDSRLDIGAGTFGDALLALKAGRRIQRSGWNGKGMWLALTEGSTFPVTAAPERAAPRGFTGAAAHVVAELTAAMPDTTPNIETVLRINAHIDMRAADGSLVIGWLASQTDMLAEDWSVLP